MFLIMFLVIMIPVAVLGGVGPGINIPGIISRLPFTESRETLAGGNGAEKVENVESLKLKVYVTEDKKIEEMDIEEYVKGVVAAEMPAAFDPPVLILSSIKVHPPFP
jgi:stage II sporulation protein D